MNKVINKQSVYEGYGSCKHIGEIIKAAGAGKVMAVCTKSLAKQSVPIKQMLDELPVDVTCFDKFSPNPDYADIVQGAKVFTGEGCDFIVSIGGGSAIDVAKCICILDFGSDSAVKKLESARCRHLAVPTTAGSGSEATQIAVIYVNGVKQSIDSEDILPDYVILDPGFLETLPLYQKKSTLLDALCQAVESLWANGANEESRGYALEAAGIIVENAEPYLGGSSESARLMIKAAYLSGKAINISRTTAAHAMSYKLTTMFGIAHGHAVALCMVPVWEHMRAIKFPEPADADAQWFERTVGAIAGFLRKWDMRVDFEYDEGTVSELAGSVNMQRLGNHPMRLSENELDAMYRNVLSNRIFT